MAETTMERRTKQSASVQRPCFATSADLKHHPQGTDFLPRRIRGPAEALLATDAPRRLRSTRARLRSNSAASAAPAPASAAAAPPQQHPRRLSSSCAASAAPAPASAAPAPASAATPPPQQHPRRLSSTRAASAAPAPPQQHPRRLSSTRAALGGALPRTAAAAPHRKAPSATATAQFGLAGGASPHLPRPLQSFTAPQQRQPAKPPTASVASRFRTAGTDRPARRTPSELHRPCGHAS